MKSRQILGTLLVLMMVGPGWSVMLSSAQSTTVSVFSTGTSEETITMSGGIHSPIGLNNRSSSSHPTQEQPSRPESYGWTLSRMASMNGNSIRPITEILVYKQCLQMGPIPHPYLWRQTQRFKPPIQTHPTSSSPTGRQ